MGLLQKWRVLELEVSFVEQFFDFQEGELDGVASIGEAAFLDLLVDPPYCLRIDCDCQFELRQRVSMRCISLDSLAIIWVCKGK